MNVITRIHDQLAMANCRAMPPQHVRISYWLVSSRWLVSRMALGLRPLPGPLIWRASPLNQVLQRSPLCPKQLVLKTVGSSRNVSVVPSVFPNGEVVAKSLELPYIRYHRHYFSDEQATQQYSSRCLALL